MADFAQGYRIQSGAREMAAALSAIDLLSNSLFSEEDVPSPGCESSLPVSFFVDAAHAGHLFVAIELATEEPVGFSAVTRVDGGAHLFQVSVAPEHGRQGWGRGLVEAAITWAREQGDSGITLTTFSHLPWNAPFYAKLGFERVEESAMGPGLRTCLEKEARAGLDPAKRVAMRLSFRSS
jgi:GNAT superfamily N-acetyltransferase